MLRDIRTVVRQLVRKPAFTLAVVLTLSLGIGATVSVFSIVNGVLLRALPYPDADRIVRVFETAPSAQGGELRSIAIPTLDDWRKDVHSFDEIALYGPETFDISGEGDQPDQTLGATASTAFFSVLGTKPYRGRTFSADEEMPGAAPVALISYGLWQRRFAGDAGIIGKSIRLDRRQFTVIGIMPSGFAYPAGTDVWAPLSIDHEFNVRDARHMSGIARLKPSATIFDATAELLAAEHRLAEVYPKNYAERGVKLISLQERTVGAVRPTLSILAGGVLLVLLVACTNIANMLVARASSRHREIALRTALGASRMRVMQEMLVESLVLFMTAGALGLAIATVVLGSVRKLAATILPRTDSIQLDTSVLLFSLAITVATGVVFGLIPAVQASKADTAASLLDGGRGSTSGRRGGRMRSALIVFETAFAAMLLVGAGLLLRSMEGLRGVDPGLPIAKVLTFRISVPPERAAEPARVDAFFQDLHDRIAVIPGVSGVGLASRLPLSGEDHSNGFHLEGEPVDGRVEHSAQDRAVSAGYFNALRIRVLAGREFSEHDAKNSAPVAMVNESFAKKWFSGNAIGHRIAVGGTPVVYREIVGVVGDTKQFGLDAPAEPEFYVPRTQSGWTFMQVAVRTQGEPLRMLGAVQKAVWSIDRELPLGGVRTLEQMTAEGGAQRRLVAVTLSAFAVVSYVLAAIGLYGVIAYAVSERTAEIGIRMALGAGRMQIGWMVMRGGLLLAMSGAAAGLVMSVPLTRWLSGLLYGVRTTDVATFLGVGVMVGVVAVVACAIPAGRAVGIDPARAMRAE